MIFFDTETFPFGPGLSVPPIVCAAFNDQLFDWRTAEHAAEHALQGDVCGHFIAYDMAVLGLSYPRLWPLVWQAYDQERVYDTQVRQQLIDCAMGVDIAEKKYGLDKLMPELQLDKVTHRMGYGELFHVPCSQWSPGARQYVLDDVSATAKLAYQQEAYGHLLADQHRQTRASFALFLTSARGMVTLPSAVQALARRTVANIEEYREDLHKAGLLSWKGKKSPEEKRELKYAASLLVASNPDTPRGKLTELDRKKGKTLGRVVLSGEVLRESTVPILHMLADYDEEHRVLTTDVPMLSVGVTHTKYKMAATGRTTSSKPAMQNLKTKGGIRECFRPRPGFVFIGADYSGLELCTWAQVCLDLGCGSKMADLLNAGIDAHCVIAASVLDITYDAMRIRKKAGRDDEEGYYARQCGKGGNFGLPGGLGVASFVKYAWSNYGVRLTTEQAANLIRIWRATYPEHVTYFAIIKELTARPGGVVKQLRSDRYRGGCYYARAANTFFQGLGGDIGKAAGYALARECYHDTRSVLCGNAFPVVFVHDEWIGEVREEAASECLDRWCEVMVEQAQIFLPQVKASVEGFASKVWTKSPKSSRDPVTGKWSIHELKETS